MLFTYTAIDATNIQREGTVESPTVDAAISAVQKRGYTLISIDEVNAKLSNGIPTTVSLPVV